MSKESPLNPQGISSLNLDAFFSVARVGHFSDAAKELHISQSALSQRIMNLESDLETTLLVRDRRGIRLTPAGEELLRHCQARYALEQETLARIKRQRSQGMTGYIRIGGFSSVMRSVILPALSKLIRKHDGLNLQFVTGQLRELPSLLRQGTLDFIVLYDEISRDDIECIHLGTEFNVLVEKKGYQGPSRYLDHDQYDETTAKYLKLTKNRQKSERHYLDDVYGLIDGARLGLGRAVVPEHLVKNDSTIEIINPQIRLAFPVLLHFYRQPYYTKLHEAVVETLQKSCSKAFT